MKLEQCTLQILNVLLSFLLSENYLFKYKHVYVDIIFLNFWVWHMVCDIEERLYTGFGNIADQPLDYYGWK